MDHSWDDYNIVLPARIVTYDAATQTASVQVSSQRVASSASQVEASSKRIPLDDVPVHTASGGGWAMTFPIKPGDTALLLFSQVGYDHWLWQDKDVAGLIAGRVAPHTKRRFSQRDGLCIVGFHTIPTAITSYSATAAQWRNASAGQIISLDANGDIRTECPTLISETSATCEMTYSTSLTVTVPVTDWTGDINYVGNESTIGNHTTVGSMLHTGPLSIISGAGNKAELAGDFEVTGNFDIVGNIGVTGEISGHTPGGPASAPTVASVGDMIDGAGGGSGGSGKFVDTTNDQTIDGAKEFTETVTTTTPQMGFTSLGTYGGVSLSASDYLSLSTIAQTDPAGVSEKNWLVLARDGAVSTYHNGTAVTETNGAGLSLTAATGLIDGTSTIGGLVIRSRSEVPNSSGGYGMALQAVKGSTGTVQNGILISSDTAGVAASLRFDNLDAVGTKTTGGYCNGKFNTIAGAFGQNVPLYAQTSAAGDVAGSAVVQTTNSAGGNSGFIGRLSTTTLSFFASSDRRLKDRIEATDKELSLANIRKVEVVDYDKYAHIWYEEGVDDFDRERGVIAQDFQKCFPEKVMTDPGNTAAEEDQLLNVTDGGMVWELVNAVQVLADQVDELKGELNALKGNDPQAGKKAQG